MDTAANFENIRLRIKTACERAVRAPDSVTLLAVSKSHPPETIHAAADCGQLFFGENKIQEAKAKIPLCPWQMPLAFHRAPAIEQSPRRGGTV
jgi:uncharacterized pyridoxal phosphate-containing UPF0001 family protein